ncbi:MAG TPA: hypothetical protein PKA80_13655 [Ignavibacteriaceae bacterium]|nr:hypothetical protein [Ignavibacteriaceae bacterium]
MLTLLLIFWGISAVLELLGLKGTTESRSQRKERLEHEEYERNLAIQEMINRLNDIGSHATELNSTKQKSMLPDVWYPGDPKSPYRKYGK